MDYADVETHCQVSFFSIVFTILTIILSIITLSASSVTTVTVLIVVAIGVGCGTVGTADAKSLSGCSTLLIIWIVSSLYTGGIASGLLLTLIYFASFFATAFTVAKNIDEKAIAEYEKKKHYRGKKNYRRRRRKYHRKTEYPQR